MKRVFLAAVVLLPLFMGIALYQFQESKLSFSDGSQMTWDEMQGKWTVVNFFAEWCKPCLEEIPELNKFHHKSEKLDAILIGVSYDPLTDEQIMDLVKRYDIEFPILLGKEKVVFPAPWPRALPTTYIFSPDGQLVKKLMGEQSYYSIKKTIKYLASGQSDDSKWD